MHSILSRTHNIRLSQLSIKLSYQDLSLSTIFNPMIWFHILLQHFTPFIFPFSLKLLQSSYAEYHFFPGFSFFPTGCSFIFIIIKFTGMTLVNKTVQVSRVKVYNTLSVVYCVYIHHPKPMVMEGWIDAFLDFLCWLSFLFPLFSFYFILINLTLQSS